MKPKVWWRTGSIVNGIKSKPQTNEEWRKTCSAENFSYWLADVCAWAMEEFRCGNTEKANIVYWDRWLKQPHKPIS